MVLKGKQWSQNVQYGLKWSSSVPNGPKWSKKIDHTFNRMVFITRFNLVLVWSKIVKNFTKSHPNGSGITRSPGLVYYTFSSIIVKRLNISKWNGYFGQNLDYFRPYKNQVEPGCKGYPIEFMVNFCKPFRTIWDH